MRRLLPAALPLLKVLSAVAQAHQSTSLTAQSNMSPSSAAVTVDTTADFSPASVSTAGRNLLLAPPSVAAREDKLRDLFAEFDRANTDLQMLDRLSAGLVALPPATYHLVLVLTDVDGARRSEALQLLGRDVYALVVPSMTVGAKLRFQDGRVGSGDAKEAILAGLVDVDGAFEKRDDQEAPVPLRLGKKKKDAPPNGAASAPKFDFAHLDAAEDDDDLIDENDLLTEEDLQRRPVIRWSTRRSTDDS